MCADMQHLIYTECGATDWTIVNSNTWHNVCNLWTNHMDFLSILNGIHFWGLKLVKMAIESRWIIYGENPFKSLRSISFQKLFVTYYLTDDSIIFRLNFRKKKKNDFYGWDKSQNINKRITTISFKKRKKKPITNDVFAL